MKLDFYALIEKFFSITYKFNSCRLCAASNFGQYVAQGPATSRIHTTLCRNMKGDVQPGQCDLATGCGSLSIFNCWLLVINITASPTLAPEDHQRDAGNGEYTYTSAGFCPNPLALRGSSAQLCLKYCTKYKGLTPEYHTKRYVAYSILLGPTRFVYKQGSGSLESMYVCRFRTVPRQDSMK